MGHRAGSFTTLPLLAGALVACGGTRSLPGKDTQTPPPAPDAAPAAREPRPLSKTDEVELVADGKKLVLAITDETGSVEIVEVGRFDAACAKGEPSEGAVWTATCGGVQLTFLHRPPNLIVLRSTGGEPEVWREMPLPAGGHLTLVP
jgi:hypothetical protein